MYQLQQKKGAHLYSDDITDSELPEPRLKECIDNEPESFERQQPEAWSCVLNSAPSEEEQSEFLRSVLPPDGEYAYCYCQQDHVGEMVGCAIKTVRMRSGFTFPV